MLAELVVRNLALIEEARILPGRGLVVVSGETGAGKTLLLGALRLLTGAEARGSQVGPFGEEAVVEGRFLLNGEEIIASRRLPRDGRSRAYLNGSLASNQLLAETLGDRVEIVGQHDQLTITRPAETRALVDLRLDQRGARLREAYSKAWEDMRRVEADRQALGGDLRGLARELDLVRYQTAEIEAARLEPGEDLVLERAASRLRHAESLATSLGAAAEASLAAAESMGLAVEEMRRAARIDPELGGVVEGVEASTEQLADLIRAIRLATEEVTTDPERLGDVESRLNLLGDLRRKYGSSLEEVLAFGNEARKRSEVISRLLVQADQVDALYVAATDQLVKVGEELLSARRRAGRRLVERAVAHLRDLGLENPVLEFEIEPAEPGPQGAERLRLLFSSDRRLPAGEVGRVASGGELSRLVLSLRLAARSEPTLDGPAILAFDEVDAGVGGRVALDLGRKLGDLAAVSQIFCVTHLPQVAAFADTHFVVERSGNSASVQAVEGERRTAELSRMLAGLPDSTRGQEAAAELLTIAQTGRKGS
jgi:DNA repair protein RecN (Recombination protein N)